MLTSRVRSTLLALAAFAAIANADQITMKNGDRLTGSVVKIDGKNLIFKSEYAGPIPLPWDAVVSVTSSEPIFVGLKNGSVISGILSLSGEKAELTSKESGAISIARADMVYIRSKTEQATYETEIQRLRNPRLIDLWTGFVDFGVALSNGNSDTTAINTSATATRATSRDSMNVNFTSIYARNNTGGASLITANAIRGGVRYELNLTKKVFAFASTDLEYDQFQGLDLRFAPAGGAGAHLWKNPKGAFDLMGGASLNREFFTTGLNRTSGEILVGEEFVRKINERTSFHEKFIFFPNVSDTGNYRMNFDASASTALKRWLSFQITLSDRYLSNPLPGLKKNDTLFTTGFRLTFAR